MSSNTCAHLKKDRDLLYSILNAVDDPNPTFRSLIDLLIKVNLFLKNFHEF